MVGVFFFMHASFFRMHASFFAMLEQKDQTLLGDTLCTRGRSEYARVFFFDARVFFSSVGVFFFSDLFYISALRAYTACTTGYGVHFPL